MLIVAPTIMFAVVTMPTRVSIVTTPSAVVLCFGGLTG
jgi:hypothetical protein